MSAVNDIFLSIVMVAENQRDVLERFLAEASHVACRCANDHEIVIVDNGSSDDTVQLLRSLCGERGIPNLQVYRLAKKVEIDIAAWAGVENALGDYVAVVDPAGGDIQALPRLLAAAVEGADVVFGISQKPPRKSILYSMLSGVFGLAAERLLGIDANKDMPFFRVVSRTVVNYMIQHQASGLAYRWLPATSGFRKVSVRYDRMPPLRRPSLLADIDRGVRVLVSSTFGPMRLVTLLCAFGALANVLYSLYVIAIALFQQDVSPGWVTLSLQQSGMFFLLSLVLLVLGEYVLHMAKLAANAPNYYVADEFTSAQITRQERLNVEVNDVGQQINQFGEPQAVSEIH
jgi:polyisoprenyl-phosphate glycosyltransferase